MKIFLRQFLHESENREVNALMRNFASDIKALDRSNYFLKNFVAPDSTELPRENSLLIF